jgi:hypothetical protein
MLIFFRPTVLFFEKPLQLVIGSHGVGILSKGELVYGLPFEGLQSMSFLPSRISPEKGLVKGAQIFLSGDKFEYDLKTLCPEDKATLAQITQEFKELKHGDCGKADGRNLPYPTRADDNAVSRLLLYSFANCVFTPSRNLSPKYSRKLDSAMVGLGACPGRIPDSARRSVGYSEVVLSTKDSLLYGQFVGANAVLQALRASTRTCSATAVLSSESLIQGGRTSSRRRSPFC